MSGVIQYGDEAEKYLVAQSIVERQDFSFRSTVVRNQVGTGGRTYSVYELGTSLLQVPFYALGRVLLNFFPAPDPNWITMLAVGLLNPILTALACVIFFKTTLRLGYRYQTAVLLTLAFGLATITFPYSKGYNREPILTVILLILFYSAVAFQQTRERRWLIANGLAAGILVFTKLIQAVVLPLFLAYIFAVIVQSRNGGRTRKSVFRELAQATGILLAPVVALLAIQGLYSYLRFGTLYGGLGGTRLNPIDIIMQVMSTGNPGVTTLRLLFSIEKSLFVYSPPILLFLVGWWKWFETKKGEALLILGLIIIAFLAAIPRPDGDTPGWWGPRYLVQVTPFFLFPISALLESNSALSRRLWTGALVILSVIGVFVQSVGVLTNNRDQLDITGIGPSLMGQLLFLRHLALDSLFIYISPTGFPVQINAFGLILITFISVLGISISIRMREENVSSGGFRQGIAGWGLVLGIEFLGFVLWAVAPYPRIRLSQANTDYAAANSFLANGRRCEASAMYLLAIDRGTTHVQDTLARLGELLPRSIGDEITPNDLLRHTEMSGDAAASVDKVTSLSADGALKISISGPNDAIARAVSDPIKVKANQTYQLSGWIRTENVYGSGSAVVTVHEDDGNYERTRGTDIVDLYQTTGWRPFERTFTTLPTTERIFIAGGLWQTYGTVWIDGLQLAKITGDNPPLAATLTPCP